MKDLRASLGRLIRRLNGGPQPQRPDKPLPKDYPFTLGVLGIMKNESMNLDEWVTHYQQVGAGKIYLIDNGSTDNSVEKARAWVAKGVVELIERPIQHQQLAHYRDAINTFNIQDRCEWLLIADLDEFWFCPDGARLTEKLKLFRNFDVIYGNWVMFGSSGLTDHPPSIRTGLIHCSEKLASHVNTKYFCRTAAIKSGEEVLIHKFRGAGSARTVSDNENFHLYHYAIQSLHYFQTVKMTRGDASTSASDNVRGMDYFRDYDAPCTKVDRALADLVDSGRLGLSQDGKAVIGQAKVLANAAPWDRQPL